MNAWIDKNIGWIILLALFVVFGTGFLTGILIRNSDNKRLEAELARSENIRNSTHEALIRSERSDKEAGIAGDTFRERVRELQAEMDRRDKIIAGMAGQIREIGTGQSDLEDEYNRFIEKLTRHGEIVDKLKE